MYSTLFLLNAKQTNKQITQNRNKKNLRKETCKVPEFLMKIGTQLRVRSLGTVCDNLLMVNFLLSFLTFHSQ